MDNQNTGIPWCEDKHLEDLDLADDLALLSQFHDHMQHKTNRLGEFAELTGLRINKVKTKIMKINATDTQPITVRSVRICLSKKLSEHYRWYRRGHERTSGKGKGSFQSHGEGMEIKSATETN